MQGCLAPFITIAAAMLALIAWFNFCDQQIEKKSARWTLEETQEHIELHSAWKKIHPEASLTFQEWEILYTHDQLPK